MNHGEAAEAYAAYFNASVELDRRFDDHDEREQFLADLAKSRSAMERAWLESIPTP
jgi:hypothetical protein